MYLVLQNAAPSDYAIGTGHAHSIAEFCEIAFEAVDLTDWDKNT